MTKNDTAIKPAPELTDNDYARIANSIHRIGELGKKLTASGLNQRAVVLLIHDATNVPMGDIKRVLQALPNLSAWYLSKAAGK